MIIEANFVLNPQDKNITVELKELKLNIQKLKLSGSIK